jgi:hypothetical protein
MFTLFLTFALLLLNINAIQNPITKANSSLTNATANLKNKTRLDSTLAPSNATETLLNEDFQPLLRKSIDLCKVWAQLTPESFPMTGDREQMDNKTIFTFKVVQEIAMFCNENINLIDPTGKVLVGKDISQENNEGENQGENVAETYATSTDCFICLLYCMLFYLAFIHFMLLLPF